MLFSSLPYAALPVSDLKTGMQSNVIQLPVWNAFHVLQGLRKDDPNFPFFCMWVLGPYWQSLTTYMVHQNLPIWLSFPSRIFSGFCFGYFGKRFDMWMPDTKGTVENCPHWNWVAAAAKRSFSETTAFASNSSALKWRLSTVMPSEIQGRSLQTNTDSFCWHNLAQGS